MVSIGILDLSNLEIQYPEFPCTMGIWEKRILDFPVVSTSGKI
jgi:hypothetical protein